MKTGIQIFTVKDSFKKDPLGTLDKLADMGYKCIEMANGNAAFDDGTGNGTDLASFKSKLSERGISLLGSHVSQMDENGLVDVSLDRWERIAEWYEKAGARYLAIALDTHTSESKLYDDCERYYKIAKICENHGLHFLYHNHFMEFQKYGNKTMFDIMLEALPENLFSLEVDTLWVMRALVDPSEFIRKYGDRIKVLHQKDYTLKTIDLFNVWNVVDYNTPVDFPAFLKTCPNIDQCTELGSGMVKIQDIINAGNEKKIEYILVEQDVSQYDEMTSVGISMSTLRKMQGIEWGG